MDIVMAFELLDQERIEKLISKRERAAADKDKRRLLCSACSHPVTDLASRIARDGAHAHTFTNPHGLVFRVGCFAAAPGCAEIGQASGEWSWFRGFQWRIALCRHCHTHLGWGYRASGGERFFGLILDRLTLSR